LSCPFCASGREREFTAEINIHFSGLKNLDKPSVLVFPRLLLCLDCGFSRFTVPEAELALLAQIIDNHPRPPSKRATVVVEVAPILYRAVFRVISTNFAIMEASRTNDRTHAGDWVMLPGIRLCRPAHKLRQR
jgi:hypothetical protein